MAGSWTAPELDRLRRLFPCSSPQRIARLLGRGEAAVCRQAERLFAGPDRSGPFSESDDAMLRQAWGVHDLDTVAMLLRRPAAVVTERAAQLRCVVRHGPWTPGELRQLKRLFGSRRAEDLAICLGRSAEDVERQAAELCLGKDKATSGVRPSGRMPRWSAAEVARLRQLYPRLDNLAIARELGRSVASVANKASQLGLGKSLERLREMGRANVTLRRSR